MIESFLRAQAESLSSVSDRATLARWHRDYANLWGPTATALAASANHVFGQRDRQSVRDEVGYLAVESQGLGASPPVVLISVNPGWSAAGSQFERPLKGQEPGDGPIDLEKYESFRRAFFPRWMNDVNAHVGRAYGAWWNHALNFLHRVAGYQPPRGMAELAADLDVIGWELWPMHSVRDGLTAAARTHTVLRDFAAASVEAALRLESQAVVLASTAGFDLIASGAVSQLQLVDRGAVGGISVARHRHQGTGRILHAIRRQLFAGWGVPRREVTSAIVGWVRGQPTTASAVRTPEAPERPVAPSLELRPVDESSDVLWIRHVSGNGDLGLSILEDDADEPDVHQRVGGYWRLGLSGPRCAAIRSALSHRRRVLVVGVASGRVVRVLEVVKDPHLPIEQFEAVEHVELRLRPRQPRALRWPGDATARWGSLFDAVKGLDKTPVRVRLHTASVDDEAWRGRRVQAAGPLGQNPGLFGTAEPLPTSQEECEEL